MNALVVVATDTDAGKTVLTSALVAYWQRYYRSRSLGLIKPVQSGVGDREWYQQLFQLDQSLEELNPVFLAEPLAPPIAAQKAGTSVDLAHAWQTFNHLRQTREWVLMESLGGLGSPVTYELTVADWVSAWQLPAVLVVPVRLGAISQAVAHVALARQSGVRLLGLILNCVRALTDSELADLMPVPLLESLTHLPVLGTMPYLADVTDYEALVKSAEQLELDVLLPR